MQLPEHEHCKYCGDPVPVGEEYCDNNCKELFIESEKAEKRKDRRFYILIGASLVAILLIGIMLRPHF